jgi:hypothetical protein
MFASTVLNRHARDLVAHNADNLVPFKGLGEVWQKYHILTSQQYVPYHASICSKHELSCRCQLLMPERPAGLDSPQEPPENSSPQGPPEGGGWGAEPPLQIY